jgi:hypothetical protein
MNDVSRWGFLKCVEVSGHLRGRLKRERAAVEG